LRLDWIDVLDLNQTFYIIRVHGRTRSYNLRSCAIQPAGATDDREMWQTTRQFVTEEIFEQNAAGRYYCADKPPACRNLQRGSTTPPQFDICANISSAFYGVDKTHTV